MRRSRKPIVIAARGSRLSQVQAKAVKRGLSRLYPELEIQLKWIVSEGDQALDVSLADRGGKGLFTSALERAVLEGEADVAVHSLKDVPCDVITPGLTFAAIPARGSTGDVLISAQGPLGAARLPDQGVVGTASPRRAAQLLRLRPDLHITLIRGNVQSRLAKLDAADSPYDATLLAAAGLERLGLKKLASPVMSNDTFLPAAGQGALCLQCRADDHNTLTRCLPLNDPAASTATHAEREVVRRLGADCHSPVCVLIEPVDPTQTVAVRNADSHWFRLRARVLSFDGSTCLDFDQQVKTRELRRLVRDAADELLSRGARELLEQARHHPIRPASSRPRAASRPFPIPSAQTALPANHSKASAAGR